MFVYCKAWRTSLSVCFVPPLFGDHQVHRSRSGSGSRSGIMFTFTLTIVTILICLIYISTSINRSKLSGSGIDNHDNNKNEENNNNQRSLKGSQQANVCQWLQGRLPPGPRGWPIIGNLHQLMFTGKKQHEIINEWANEFGEVFTFRIFSTRFVILNSLPLIQKTFQNADINDMATIPPCNKALGVSTNKGIYPSLSHRPLIIMIIIKNTFVHL